MHLWHHVKELPKDRKYGVNYGITLSIWDYLFKTDYVPHEGRDEALGFDGMEEFPKTFWTQITYPFVKRKSEVGIHTPPIGTMKKVTVKVKK